MVCKDTLRIKHLPKELSDTQKEDFIRHFGAHKVKVITSKVKAKSVVYAKFENEEVAKNAMLRLHQINILNCRLCVEYAETDILQGQLVSQRVEGKTDGSDKKFFSNFIKSINGFNDSVGFYQPPPSHLKYNYPKANRATINNIAHALATVPRFYTQVLHLMNKMNLPPPFAMPDPPVRAIPPQIQIAKKRKAESESESEIESEGEGNRQRDVIPQKRVVQKKVVKRPKFIKQPVGASLGSTSGTVGDNTVLRSKAAAERLESVFEKVEVQPLKKIELKVTSQDPTTESHEALLPPSNIIDKEVEYSPQRNIVEPERVEFNRDAKEEPIIQMLTSSLETSASEAASIIDPDHIIPISKPPLRSGLEKSPQLLQEEIKTPPDLESSRELIEISSQVPLGPTSPEEEFPCISLEELRANQVTDLTVMPVFKNYSSGEPTNKLYIKNCAKTVVEQDLEYIYNRYREEGRLEKPSEFNIRLMQEGRMKGQAFVTLDSVEQAQKAVNETNGFILKDKPLVVAFGKAGKKK
ncbi:RNA-binding region-containing protein 3-like [Euwallacea similis]|uniref:RNA-binding region-containing protein 3-like n=1 Tax=Euwallacea similis TaxID=1736056 RepID=UPI00344D0118